MSSFSGCKLVGINPSTKEPEWAKVLAEYLTNEKNQIKRYEARHLGPSNKVAQNSDEVEEDPVIAALAMQSEFASPQRVGGNYWKPAEELGLALAGGSKKNKDVQKLLDEAVEGITAPVGEK